MREWRDPSPWLSASAAVAAAGRLLAGEGGMEGLIKCELQQSQ